MLVKIVSVLSCSPVMLHCYARSAGDVLQDIGSMLSDLTDELDAMLKLDKEDQ